jgi:hypothetical protein
MESCTTSPPDAPAAEIAARARAIRVRLPGQMLAEREATAQLYHGPLYSLAEIRQRVGEVLPQRFGYIRSAALERAAPPWSVLSSIAARFPTKPC